MADVHAVVRGQAERAQTSLEGPSMATTVSLQHPSTELLDWLARAGVEYEIHEHREAITAEAIARAEGVDPRTFAKVLGVATDDGREVLCVLDAPDHLDLRKIARLLGCHQARLLPESRLAELAPGCEVGAMPAVGALFGLATYADYGVRDDPAISFNAGSHRFSARVDRAGWERASVVRYGDLAEDANREPAWSH
jgi:Ala-tRNA(Pro) deacylase